MCGVTPATGRMMLFVFDICADLRHLDRALKGSFWNRKS